MKNTFYLFALLCFFSFSSCLENEISFSDSPTNSLFEVTIDGELFTTDVVDYTADSNTIFINALKPETNEIFTIKVSNFGIGTHNLDDGSFSNFASYVRNNTVPTEVWLTVDQQTVVSQVTFTHIDDVNDTVSGTFNFKGENAIDGSSKTFTNGSFNGIPKSILPSSNNTFTAKVDGVEFNEISLFGNLVDLGGQEVILISANKSLSETIALSINSDITVGEYDFGSFITQTYPTGQYTLDGSTYVADGRIIITSHDTTNRLISGTFEFEASPIINSSPNFSITEGAFSISY